MRHHPLLRRAERSGIRLGLERIEALLGELGHPQARYPAIHVAGTNGKGSVCAAATAILRAGGLRVGTYLSPHLQEVNERIQVDGRPVDDPTLDRLLDRVGATADRWAATVGLEVAEGALPLTYFEALTAAALLHFAEAGVDVAVVEVGLGGRLDATRVVRAAVGAITTIGLDHTDRLGPDLASIAAEKAGICVPGLPVLTGALPPIAARVVERVAEEEGALPLRRGRDWDLHHREGGFDLRVGERELAGLETALPGLHQRENAALAAACALHFARATGRPLPDEAVRGGLRAVRHPGRLEWLGGDLLLDGAHNAEGAAALARYLAAIPRDCPRTLLFGGGRDKDLRAVAAVLAGQVDRIFTTACAHPRAAAPGEVAERLVGLPVPVYPVGRVEEALPLVQQTGGLVVVAGSLFLAGAVRDLLGAG